MARPKLKTEINYHRGNRETRADGDHPAAPYTDVVVGLDLSLSCTGVAVITDGKLNATARIRPTYTPKSLEERCERVQLICDAIVRLLRELRLERPIIAIEEYAFASRVNVSGWLGELHMPIMQSLFAYGVAGISRVPGNQAAATLKVKYTMKDKKAAVNARVCQLYGVHDIGLDESDALAVAHHVASVNDMQCPAVADCVRYVDGELVAIEPKQKRGRK